MGSKSFTIDHILHGPSAPAAVDPLMTSVGDHSTYPDVHPQPLVPYWTGDPAAYYPPSGWPNAAAIWFQSQQQHHHAAMPVDLSTGAQRPVPTTGSIGPSLFDNVSNWMAMPSPAAAMTGCWPSAASPELSYSHHGLSTPMTSASVASPFFLAHPHSHDAAIRLAAMAASRRHHHHHHLPILHQQATRKGGQIRFTHRQSHHLEETFNSTRYLTPGQRRTLANRLSLTERQVKTWFQNRRAKWRRTRKGEKLSANGLAKVADNQTTIDIFDEKEENEDDDDDLEISSEEEEEKPNNPNNQ
ncbi:hematopoietically-expressed homeobox protein hhex-like [Daphnia pulex]|uniref:hematopoietically-expressed homeobox protein hhex-like n=1 Tax=Daphnia pulex TaxID=6669 RepID=UPI001EDD0300|nr:hematopoietically-expressed homeobox protein hhex-like [Daphnia pulex]XP_046441912.1 hematopoietically-expressed homeobox protein hhex-like [Daphnia pulex]